MYTVFICLIIACRVEYIKEENKSEKFSNKFPNKTLELKYYVNKSQLKYKFELDDFYFRADTFLTIDTAIIIWIIGLAWLKLKQIYTNHIKEYFHLEDNSLDLIMIVLYVVSYLLKFFTILLVRKEKRKLSSLDFWMKFKNLSQHDLETQKDVYLTFYRLNAGKNKVVKIVIRKIHLK